MATATKPEGGAKADAQFVKYDQYIEQQVGKARGTVKSVELFSELLLLSVAVLVYLLLFVLADHWVFSNGLGMFPRTLALMGLIAGVGAAFWFRLLPILLGKVNPIYAADCIERSQPTLKNSLINFLLLRTARTPMAKVVYEAIEQRAATDLSHVQVESSVDRTRLIRIFYVLMALVAFACLYKLVSPKDPLVSLGRVILPWMDVEAPTRVTIQEVTPGDSTAFTGQTVKVTALVTGIEADEEVTLYYSTEDGSVADQQIKLVKPEDGYRHEARLPEGSDGLGQALEYYLVAGDVQTRRFRLAVQPPPTISVQMVSYDYPRYTDLGRRDVPWKGDIKAIEGTQITIKAETNQPIKSAVVDFNCDGRSLLPMRIEGQSAYATFALNRESADYHSYLLRFRNMDGHTNPSPTRYQIEMVRDKPPTLEFVQPGKDIELPANSVVKLKLRAADQDFKLAQVHLFVNKGDEVFLGTKAAPGEQLLRGGHVPSFEGDYLINAKKLGLSPGEELTYWGMAIDNKSPQPNMVESQKWKIKIVAPQDDPQQPMPDQLAKNDPPKQENPPRQPNDPQPQPGDNTQQGDAQPENQQPADGSQDGQQPPDPETDPSRAIEELSKLFQKNEPQKPEDQEQQAKNDKQEPDQNDQQQNQDNQGGGKSDGSQQQQDENAQGDQSKDGNSKQKSDQQQKNDGNQKSEQNEPGSDPQNAKQQPKDGDTKQPDNGKQGNQKQDSKDGNGKQQKDNKGQPQGAGKKEQGTPQQQPGQSKDGAGQPGKEQPKKDGGNKSQDGNSKGDNPNQSAGKKGDAPKGQPKNDGADNSGQPIGDQPDTKGNPNNDGAAEAKPGDAGKKEPNPRKGPDEPIDGGDRDGKSGDTAGDGKQTDGGATPTAQGKSNPRDLNNKSKDENKQSNEESPKSPSISDHESDSQGDQGGDRSGGGEEGGGQRSPKPGKGAAGTSTPSETGGGKGPGSGDADKVNRPGNKAPSGSKTGTPGSDKQGNGSKTQQSPEGAGDGQNPNSPAGGSQGKQAQPREVSTDKNVDKGDQAGSGDAKGSAKSGPGGPGAGAPAPGTERKSNNRFTSDGTQKTQAEDANLEYAKKTVDLMLKSIDDELAKDQISPELKERGYTREHLESLQKKFRSLRDKARAPDATEADQQAFEDTLRSLGLSPGPKLDTSNTAKVRNRNREGISVPPPPEYRNRVNSFKSSISKPLE